MSTTPTYIDHIVDLNGNTLYLRDKEAQEMLVHKVEKTIVNALPAKPTTKDAWLAMEPFLYYVPIDGQENDYQCWTLFFVGDSSVASDYTDTNNYVWAMITDTDMDVSNFSTKGHTHEVIPETTVDDHEFTPQGEVNSTFQGNTATIQGGTHKHNFSLSGSVSGNISGTQKNTENAQADIQFTKDGKKLTTQKLHVSQATGVNFSGSTTNGTRATGGLTAKQTFDNAKTLLHSFHVDNNNGLVFDMVEMDTANDTVTNLQASIDASKVMVGSSTATGESGQDFATGAVESGSQLVGHDATVSDSGHSHQFTPEGSFSANLPTGTMETENASHSHDYTPTGTVRSGFEGVKINLKHKVDNKKVRTAPDSEDEGSHAFDWYGIEFDEDESNPEKTRVGNRDMHRMLPIQTKMRRCLLNDDGTVNYYLDPNDSTKRAGSQEGYVTSEETFMSKVETDEIRDETEEIGVIKGNTGELNQLFDKTTFWNSGEINGITYTNNGDGSVTVSPGTATDSAYFTLEQFFNSKLIPGHKYYIKGAKSPVVIRDSYSGQFQTNESIIWTAPNEIQEVSCSLLVGNGNTVSQTMRITPQWFDLTLMGIDSFTTVQQVEAYLAKNFGQRSYYPYNAGTLLSNTMKGIQTVGFNKWDEEWELGQWSFETGQPVEYSSRIRSKNYIQVSENTRYFHNGIYEIVVCFFDSNKNILQYVKVNTDDGFVTNKAADCYAYCPSFVTPQNCAYIKFTVIGQNTYNHDICINISDPAKNGTYEPYNLHSYQRDVTQITGINPNTGVRELVAPNGLQKADMAGTVIDSIYNDVNGNAVCKKMCGMRAYASGDESDSTVITDLTNTIYGLTTPVLYTDLQWGDGSPVILPIEIEAEKNSTIKIVPPHGDGGEELLMAAPTLQMKKYVLTQGANLDGSDGQVMVEIPEHWRKVYRYTSGGHSYLRAMLSPYPQDTTGWIHVKQNYISAYEARIDNSKLCSVSDVKDLVLSVVDGKVNATCDVSVATGQSDITSKLPTTDETMNTFRTAARARGNVGEAMWNMLVYEQYIDLYWLYVIEYANLNSQAAFTTVLDNEGFHQGGLGDGATTVLSSNWNTFNGYKPFVPCGITNCLGNQSGEVLLALPSTFGTNAKIPVASYRGVENPFGHIWKFADGIKYLGDGIQQDIRRCDNPADYSSESSTTNYPSIGNNYGGDGWKKKIVVGDDGDINCAATGAGNLSYYCDYNYKEHANGTYYCCLLGGNARDGSLAGLAYVHSYNGVPYSYTYVGSRLCFFNK